MISCQRIAIFFNETEYFFSRSVFQYFIKIIMYSDYHLLFIYMYKQIGCIILVNQKQIPVPVKREVMTLTLIHKQMIPLRIGEEEGKVT